MPAGLRFAGPDEVALLVKHMGPEVTGQIVRAMTGRDTGGRRELASSYCPYLVRPSCCCCFTADHAASGFWQTTCLLSICVSNPAASWIAALQACSCRPSAPRPPAGCGRKPQSHKLALQLACIPVGCLRCMSNAASNDAAHLPHTRTWYPGHQRGCSRASRFSR
jgi:hypothetical protein